MKLRDKYIFRQYNSVFPKLFEKEKQRLQKVLSDEVQIDHIGSTAVPGLWGKGVIDISVVVSKNDWSKVSKNLERLGYKYKKKEADREKERLFFMANLPDKELDTRLYHIHLSYPESSEFKKEIGFRDYLRNHPKDVKRYAKIKKLAAENAQKFRTKDEMRNVYGKTKEDFIKQILEKLNFL